MRDRLWARLFLEISLERLPTQDYPWLNPIGAICHDSCITRR